MKTATINITNQLKNLDFLLSHLSEPLFPRTIFTHKRPYQFSVASKQEIFHYFANTEFIDCKINAFPSLKEYASWTPDFIFIDLDLADFKSKRALDLALNKTLKNIRERLEGHPTVIWTGGGYHIYQPIEGIIFEKYTFNEFGNECNLFNEFLRFSKTFLSNGKADKQNNPTLKSCLLRIPGSVNSKYNTDVRIVQKWNGSRPSIILLIGDFFAYLVDRRQKELRNLYQKNNIQNGRNTILWIEKLLETPIEDGRKYTLWKILCPYLVNIKKLEYEESYKLLKTWLEKCNNLRRLDFNPNIEIKIRLRYVKHYQPISITTLKNNNKDLYLLLRQKDIDLK